MVVEAEDTVVADFAMRSFRPASDLTCSAIPWIVEFCLLEDAGVFWLELFLVEDLVLIGVQGELGVQNV